MDQLPENLATVEFVPSVDEAVGLDERARVAHYLYPDKNFATGRLSGKREQLFLAVQIPPLMHAEFDTLFWPKSYPCVDLGRSRGSQREPKAAQYRGQTKDSFSHCEVLADAHTRTDSERRIRKPPLYLISKPALRAKSLRFRVPAGIAVEPMQTEPEIRPSGD